MVSQKRRTKSREKDGLRVYKKVLLMKEMTNVGRNKNCGSVGASSRKPIYSDEKGETKKSLQGHR